MTQHAALLQGFDVRPTNEFCCRSVTILAAMLSSQDNAGCVCAVGCMELGKIRDLKEAACLKCTLDDTLSHGFDDARPRSFRDFERDVQMSRTAID